MIIGLVMIAGGIVFAHFVVNPNSVIEIPPIFLLQGLLLAAIVASAGVVVIALGRINESISEQTDYLIEKMGIESKQAKEVNGKLVEDIDEYDEDIDEYDESIERKKEMRF
jgi:hypothetical protein